MFAGLFAAPGEAGAAEPGADARHRITADQPATEWLLGHPVGNGQLGAMMGGGIARDTLSLNHDTLWSGQPAGVTDHDGREALAAVRQAVFAGDPVGADRLSKSLQGPFSASYAPMAARTLLKLKRPSKVLRKWCSPWGVTNVARTPSSSNWASRQYRYALASFRL